MKKTISQAIEDCTKALREGCAESMVRWTLIKEGWSATRATQITLWAKQKASVPPNTETK